MSNLTKVTPETFAAVEAHVERAQRLHPWHVNKRYRGFLLNAPRGDEDVSASEIIKSEWQELALELLNMTMSEERLQRVLDEAMDLTVVAMRLVQKAINDLEMLRGGK
jgi:hypothetical protein